MLQPTSTGLEERLNRKIAQAAAAVGVTEILPGSKANEINFAETRSNGYDKATLRCSSLEASDAAHFPARDTARNSAKQSSSTRALMTTPPTRYATAPAPRSACFCTVDFDVPNNSAISPRRQYLATG
ncbi:MAG: hypothetical protein O3B90_12405 [Actinomycetota bacterium]|nr:hypothetical protein [Actinomycetota bacterium]